ncbi:MAG: DUF1992 domain-containing protein, partial [Deltaproteobacteria bacterium]|nr:DUF1992 domain-containing protein [Deltaproteobacteria bacterium]
MLEHNAIAFVAEQKIQEALQNGEFDQLPGAGKPLAMEDLSHLPPEMRMAYTILKNSGFVDAPQDMQRPLSPDKEFARSSPEEGTTNHKLRRLDLMMRRIGRARGQSDFLPPILDLLYLDKLLKRVQRTVMKYPCDAVFFDLDGTLLDSVQDLADAKNAALRAFNLPEHPV